MKAKSKPRKAPPAKPVRSSDVEEHTRRRACELYEQRGRIDGFALDDWLEAERDSRSAETTEG
jgi:hypothetical protein